MDESQSSNEALVHDHPISTPTERACRAEHPSLKFGTLCSVCEAIDFDDLLAPAISPLVDQLRARAVLGALSQVRECSIHCPFCKIVFDHLPSTIGPEAISLEKIPRVPRSIDHWAYDVARPSNDEITINLRPFAAHYEQLQDLPMMQWKDYRIEPSATWLAISVSSGGLGSSSPSKGMVITSPRLLVPYEDDVQALPLTGRTILPQLNYNDLRQQLRTCIHSHDDCSLRWLDRRPSDAGYGTEELLRSFLPHE